MSPRAKFFASSTTQASLSHRFLCLWAHFRPTDERWQPLEAVLRARGYFFWNVATGKLLKHLHGDAEDLLEAIAISPDGKVLAAGGKNKTICLWDVATEKVIRRLEGIEQGRILFLAFAAPGKVLASLAEDWTVRLWDAETGKMLRQLKGDMATMCNMAVSRDGRLVATGGSNGTLHLWDSQAGTETPSMAGAPHRH